jgi:hypothetical protein
MAILKITGLKQARDALRRLAAIGEKQLRPPLEAAAKPLADAVRSGSPRSAVSVRPVRAPRDGSIMVSVVIVDDATPPQRQAVSSAYHGTKSSVKSIGEREITKAVEREVK